MANAWRIVDEAARPRLSPIHLCIPPFPRRKRQIDFLRRMVMVHIGDAAIHERGANPDIAPLLQPALPKNDSVGMAIPESGILRIGRGPPIPGKPWREFPKYRSHWNGPAFRQRSTQFFTDRKRLRHHIAFGAASSAAPVKDSEGCPAAGGTFLGGSQNRCLSVIKKGLELWRSVAGHGFCRIEM